MLCASYSGNTEETLAIYDAAGALGARRIVATTGGKLAEAARAEDVPVIPLPGGFQPRAAVAYSLVVALEVAWLCGAGERLHAEIDVAAAHLEQIVSDVGPGRARRLARQAAGARASRHDPADRRLRAHVTDRVPMEDADQRERKDCRASRTSFPSSTTTRSSDGRGRAQLGRFSAVFLDDSDLHPRIRQRIELTRGLIEAEAAGTYRVESVGQNRTERLISLVLLGDLVSLYLAVLREVDPTPVAADRAPQERACARLSVVARSET